MALSDLLCLVDTSRQWRQSYQNKKNTSITTSCRRKEKVLSHAQLPQKRKKLDDVDLKIMKALEPENPNAPMSFFRSFTATYREL
nr:unnamed protein product [Callosobruchus analis]